MRVNASSSGIVIFGQRADDLVHVAAGAEVAAGAGDDDGLDVARVDEAAKQVAQLGIRLERQRILRSGRSSVIVATLPSADRLPSGNAAAA